MPLSKFSQHFRDLLPQGARFPAQLPPFPPGSEPARPPTRQGQRLQTPARANSTAATPRSQGWYPGLPAASPRPSSSPGKASVLAGRDRRAGPGCSGWLSPTPGITGCPSPCAAASRGALSPCNGHLRSQAPHASHSCWFHFPLQRSKSCSFLSLPLMYCRKVFPQK